MELKKIKTQKSFIIQILLIISLVSLINTKLQILSPSTLKSKFMNGVIKANYANFGYIPYGHTIMGSVHFENKNIKACNTIDDTIKPESESKPQDNSIKKAPFFIAERGDCTFVKKVRNIENAGYAVAIIIDDNENENPDVVVMSDDGTGGGIMIPSMLISKADGQKLLNFLKRASQEEHDQMGIMVSFDLDKPDNRVEYDIWLTSSNDKALDFIAEFKSTDKELGANVLMSPHYVFWRCDQCEKEYLDNDCFGGGKYCAVESSNEQIRGRDIILEDLRQICIYKQVYSDVSTRHIWWSYIQQVHQNCYGLINEDCSKNAHSRLLLSFEKTQQCVKDSFFSSDWSSKYTNNTLIDNEVNYWKKYGSGIYPSIVINNRTYRGQIEKLAVYNALCAGFQNPPDICVQTLGVYTPEAIPSSIKNPPSGVTGAMIVLLVFVVIILNVVIVYCYRRYTRREMQSEMQMKIESAVSQYFALSQNNSKPYLK